VTVSPALELIQRYTLHHGYLYSTGYTSLNNAADYIGLLGLGFDIAR